MAIRVSGAPREEAAFHSEIDEVLRLIAEQACLATAATSSAIALKQQDEIICRATAGPNTPDLGMALNTSSGLSGACVRTREPQYCEDTETDPRVNAEACRRLQVRSVLVVPLIRDAELSGIFEIFSPLPKGFSRHDLQNLQALANVVLDSLQNPDEAPTPAAVHTEPSLVSVSPPEEVAKPRAEAVRAAPPPRETARVVSEREKEGAPAPNLHEERLGASDAGTSFVAPVEIPVSPARAPAPKTKAPLVWVEVPTDDGELSVEPPSLAARTVPQMVPPAWNFEAARGSNAVSSMGSTPRDAISPGAVSPAEFSPTLSASAPQRDWISTTLTVAVVALAVVLGWMLGRVGWERAMGSRAANSSAAAQPATPQARALPPASTTDNDPIVVEPGRRNASANRTPAMDPPENEVRPLRTAPASPKAKTDGDASGGLVVFQNGRVIFRQNVAGASDRSVTSSVDDSGFDTPSGNAAEGTPVPVSSQVAGAHLVQRIEPIYPEQARQRFIQGEVVLEAVVGKEGSVQELTLISGDSQLAEAAAAAVEQWRFRPYEQHGKPTAFSTRLTVNFRLH